MAWRDVMCGELRADDAGRSVTVAGWADTRRDHGGLVFVDLRDHTGKVQLVINPEHSPAAAETAHEIRNEFVLQATGEVVARAPELVNPNLPTGQIEVQVDELRILSRSTPLPFQLDEENVDETLRLRYRWLDLRTERMQRNIRLNHTAISAISGVDGRARLRRRPDADLDARHARGRARLPRPGAAAAGALLRAAQSPQLVQAALHGRRVRALLPDRDLLPRRGSPRRPRSSSSPSSTSRWPSRTTSSCSTSWRASCSRSGASASASSRRDPVPAHDVRRGDAAASAPTSRTCATSSRSRMRPRSTRGSEFGVFKSRRGRPFPPSCRARSRAASSPSSRSSPRSGARRGSRNSSTTPISKFRSPIASSSPRTLAALGGKPGERFSSRPTRGRSSRACSGAARSTSPRART